MPVYFRSYADLSIAILQGLHRIPSDIDLVVGIPRSGMVPASMVALARNVAMADLEGYLRGNRLAVGETRRGDAAFADARSARHILLVDDSLASGRSLAKARQSLKDTGVAARVTTFVPYVQPGRESLCDVTLEAVPSPRAFGWNILHHPLVGHMGVDIDGVLCRDPLPAENDDGPKYTRFVEHAPLKLAPTKRVGGVVTNRLARYRAETERWLAAHDIAYDELVMLDLPDAAARRRTGDYVSHKASTYAARDWQLFVESEPEQAEGIAARSGKPVLCWETQQLIEPGMQAWRNPAHLRRRAVQRLAAKAKGIARRVLLAARSSR